MALSITREVPSVDQYTSLEDHQAQTPATFFGGKPILYCHQPSATLSMERQDLENNPVFASLRSASTRTSTSTVAATNGDSTTHHEQIALPGIDIWVTSEFLILFSPSASTGVQIPYPTISLHAQQAAALYMQLSLSDMANTADDDLETLELLLTPAAPLSSTSGIESSDPTQSPSAALYAAVSACADLHPDPDSDDEGEDPAQMPGAGGWITSENMHDFVDEQGNFRLPSTNGGGDVDGEGAGLGAGAGTRRAAEEFEDAEDETDETKWRRTG